MTDEADEFWNRLYRGCGLPGHIPLPVREGCAPPDAKAIQERVFRFYENGLHRNKDAASVPPPAK
jgi:hypothetical protein